eukprot:IDg8362t1
MAADTEAIASGLCNTEVCAACVGRERALRAVPTATAASKAAYQSNFCARRCVECTRRRCRWMRYCGWGCAVLQFEAAGSFLCVPLFSSD